mgnify:CR=1 FL=1
MCIRDSGSFGTLEIPGKFILSSTTRISLSNNDAGSFNTVFGKLAGDDLASGGNANSFFGENAGHGNTTGTDNVAIGINALKSLPDSDQNVVVGSEAMKNLDGTANGLTDCVAIGFRAFLGTGAGTSDPSGTVAIGSNSLSALTSGIGNVAIGSGSMAVNATSDFNVAIGTNALGKLTSDGTTANTAVGYQAGLALTTGVQNTAIGFEALKNSDDASNNTALGYRALTANAANNNTGIGYLALRATTGTQNTAVGMQASHNIGGGANNVSLGMNSLLDVVDGSQNVAIGSQAIGGTLGTTADNASDLIAIGYQAMGGNWENISLTDNIAIGTSAMGGAINGTVSAIAIGKEALDGVITTATNGVIAIGYQSGKAITGGNGTVAIGYQSLTANTIGIFNTAIGFQALKTNVDGSTNTAVGYLALTTFEADAQDHGENTAVGSKAGTAVSTGTGNTLIGKDSGLAINTGDNNTVIGAKAGDAMTTSNDNVAIGLNAIGQATTQTDRVVAIGSGVMGGGIGAADITGLVAIGYEALAGSLEATTDFTVAIGYQALKVLTSGAGNTAVGTNSGDALTIGEANTTLGVKALSSEVEGGYNVAIGYEALFNQNAGGSDGSATVTGNTAIGFQAGDLITIGSNCVLIGTSADPSANNADNQIVIGSGATGVEDNSVTLGNASVTAVYMSQDSGATVHAGNVSGSSTSTGSFGHGFIADKLGIGTVSPSSALDIHDTSGVDNKIRFHNSTTGTGTSNGSRIGLNGAELFINNIENSLIKIYTQGNSTTGLNINGSNNVGIGTVSPAKQLHLSSSAANNFILERSGTSNAAIHYKNAAEDWYAGITSGEDFSISSNADIAAVNTGFKLDSDSLISLSNNDSNTGNTIIGSSMFNNSSNNDSDYNTLIGASVMGTGAVDGASHNVGIGADVLADATTASDNVAIGSSAMLNATTSDGNVAIGRQSIGAGVATGNDNTAIGMGTLKALTSGVNNVAVGHNAGLKINSGEANAIIGKSAGDALTSGDLNTVVGYFALSTSTDVDRVVAIGPEAMESGNVTSAADGTVAIGSKALQNLTTGEKNIAIGFEALKTATELDDNVAIGYRALQDASGSAGSTSNIAIGALAGKDITSGKFNVLVGRSAGDQQTTADANTYMGYFAGYSTISGSENVFIGRQAGYEFRNANSPYNVYIGSFTGYHNRTGRYNTYIGGSAGFGASGQSHSSNVGVGYRALLSVTTGGNNTVMGRLAADAITSGASNIVIGDSALGTATTATETVAIGSDAMSLVQAGQAITGVVAIGQNALKGGSSTTTGINGTIAIGKDSLKVLTSGAGNTAVGTNSGDALTIGEANTTLGVKALSSEVEGGYNVAIGYEALFNQNAGGSDGSATVTGNTAIGFQAGDLITIGSNCVLIGTSADPSANNADNQIVIGSGATGVANNSVTLGNADVTAVYMAQDSGATVHAGILNLTGGQITTSSGNIALNANSGLVTTAAFQSTSANLSFFSGPLNVGGNLALADTKQLSTSTFISGIAGDGFRIIDNGGDGVSMEIDNIMVRKTLRTHIFQKDTVKATNGILMVTDAAVISGSTSTANDTGTVTFIDEKSATFSAGDRVLFKDADEATGTINSVEFTITASGVTAGSGFTKYGVSSSSGSLSDLTGSIGGTVVRVSGGSLVLDASSANSPFMDVMAGSGSGAAGNTKARLGNLAGVVSPRFGTLSGFGIWASGSAFFEGSINATTGNIGGWGIGATAISSSGGIVDIDAGVKRITIRSDATTDRVYLGEIADDDDYGLKIFDGTGTNDSDLLVELGSNQNMIAGWDLTPGNIVTDNAAGSVRLSSTAQALTIWTGSVNEAEPKLVVGKLPLNDGTVDQPYGFAVFSGAGTVSGSEASASVLITANKARLAGWELIPGRLSSGTVADINGNNASIALGTGATTATGTPTDGLFFVSASASPVFYVGSTFSYVDDVLKAGGWEIGNGQISSSNGNAILSGSGILSLGTGTHGFDTANRTFIDGPGNRMSIGTGFKYESDSLTIDDNASIGGFSIGATQLTSNPTGNGQIALNESFLRFKANNNTSDRLNSYKITVTDETNTSDAKFFPQGATGGTNDATKFVRIRMGMGEEEGFFTKYGGKADGANIEYTYNNAFGEPRVGTTTTFPMSESFQITMQSASREDKNGGVSLRYQVFHGNSADSGINAGENFEVMRIGKLADTGGDFAGNVAPKNRVFHYGISGSSATTSSFGLVQGDFLKGDGSKITNLSSAAIDGVANMANNRVITAVDGTTVNAEANLVFTGTKLGIGTDSPLNLLQINGSGADGANGISIVRSDSSTVANDLLGGISFDSTDGNVPSSILQGSAYIAAYASEIHGTSDKGGYLTFGTAPDNQNDDTTSTERMRIDSNSRISISNNDGGGTGGSDSTSANTLLGFLAGDDIASGGVNNSFVGHAAGHKNTTGDENSGFGRYAGFGNLTGDNNTFVGSSAGLSDNGSSHSNNTGIGKSALTALTTGGNNTAVGYATGDAVTTASGSVFLGFDAGGTVTTGNQNIAIGLDSMNGGAVTGDNNIAVGASAGDALTSGYDNVLMGSNAGGTATDNKYIIAIGKDSLKSANNGEDYQIGIGINTLALIDNGNSEYNIAIGHNAVGGSAAGALSGVVIIGQTAGYDISSGDASYTVGIGFESVRNLTSGIGNVAVGMEALKSITDADYNTAIGHQALKAQSGQSGTVGNTAVGHGAAETITTSVNITALGFEALSGATTEADGNTAIGFQSMDGNWTTAAHIKSVAVGGKTMRGVLTADSSGTVAIGYDALSVLTSGTKNVAVGFEAGKESTIEDFNTYIGYQSGYRTANLNNQHNTFVGHSAGSGDWTSTLSSKNTAVGSNAMVGAMNSGLQNSALGYAALQAVTTGNNNIGIGVTAGDVITTGGSNTIIGSESDPSANSATNQTVVGYGTTGVADNSVSLGNASVTAVYIAKGNDTSQDLNFFDSAGGGGNIQYTHSDDQMKFGVADAVRVRIFASALLVGRSSAGSTGNGHSIRTADSAIFSRDASGETIQVCRNADNGQFIQFKANGSVVGDIKNTGGTVSLTGFSGCHESSSPDTLEVGLVVSTIDEEHSKNHAKVKISDSVGDKRVYGVVSDLEGLDGSNVTITSVGISSIKVTGSCVGGDLLESNGDGTAKVQSDDIIRSKTIGKVTMSNSTKEVKMVSCVLYCG